MDNQNGFETGIPEGVIPPMRRSSPRVRVPRLGFREIVPGLDASGTPEHRVPSVHIPEFDLAASSMARQRRLSSERRRGPGHPPAVVAAQQPEAIPLPVVSETGPRRTGAIWATYTTEEQIAVVADIVRRDLARFFKGRIESGV